MQLVGIYARLSVEHGNEKDNSIENQILLARRWIQEHSFPKEPLQEYQCYIDRGYSGTSFQRPGFMNLLEDARMQKIQCVVCKDYSRLGRDYLRTGEYIEKIFPMWGIRLVCISDGYDSLQGLPGSLEGSMRNLMNEWYARDIGQKVHLVKQQKKREGNYLGSRPPYGYRIVRQNGKRVLSEEEETMKIVRLICKRKQQGDSLEDIRKLLQKKGINPPGEYQKTGMVYQAPSVVKKWDSSTLRYLIAHQRGLPHD